MKRLGQSSAQGPRLLLVRLSLHSDVVKTLRSRFKIQADISVSTDKTPLQRESLRKLRDELSRLNEADPTCPKVIKYVAGVPEIIDQPVTEEVAKN